MPEEVRSLCRLADITAKSTLLQIVRQGDPKKMIALVERVAAGGGTRKVVRAETAKGKAGRPKPFVFAFRPPTKAFNLSLSFTQVARRARARDHRSASKASSKSSGRSVGT